MSKSQEPAESDSAVNASTRRSFLKGGGLMLAGGAIGGSKLNVARGAHAFGSDSIKIGLIGCGGRGTGAAIQMLGTEGDAQLVAMADVFQSNLQTAYRTIKSRHPKSIPVDHRRFVGLDAYRGVMESDAELLILATPPGFRPEQFEAAVESGKHVFMEKPVATDAPGVRRVLAANEIAKEKGLAVQVGLQRRHEIRYRECIENLQSGRIGNLLFARVYWNGGETWFQSRKSGQSELEYQMRNWHHFNWLGGDQIVEQHIHNLDVINWLMQSHPVEAQGQGGRAERNPTACGHVFDQHMVEFTYAGGFKLLSQCRHRKGCWNSISEHVHGTHGTAIISDAMIRDGCGKKLWQSNLQEIRGKGWQQEQHALIASLRAGQIPNEGDYGAYSTMTAIMGRMATYSGKRVKWDDAFHSEVRLAETQKIHSLADSPPVQKDETGNYPLPVPGSGAKHV
ncbi:MAG: Gfo/Idh/MocA family oxidoreductase [Planctomycetota bacterium]|nr:Gfo/Idh/MocA family oxidoreductase [Planctomycetota bacterium]